jgi:hypothetical protein
MLAIAWDALTSRELNVWADPGTNGLKSRGEAIGNDMSRPPMMISSSVSGKGEFTVAANEEVKSSQGLSESSCPVLPLPNRGDVAVVVNDCELLSEENGGPDTAGFAAPEDGAEAL